ncbi:MAG: hypothetical protein ACTIA3_01460 [Corynebacterium casei]|uniref:Histone n=2 Tax=Corynebacterium casei TaxID=160386 RepID=G7HYG2_9CORY|nr:hypothetical protein [Corynebacterium casei]MDN5705615.1 hypothetical protein [Corynebacterium casei]MDN5727920.1 hypothetical protein [Corynebacterium casei]MDN5739938.1 hypothetical protein [Corynebacterium casei]MDN5783885.1 hypothetical protein [Corynebacterium casei]MDN5799195.1 hypothetical protein [Corynebacterium casei]
MPPKVTDTQPAAEQMHAVEEETARSARRVVATYAQDFLDGVTLMSMLGVEPEGLIHKKVLAEQVEAEPKTTRKKATKKAAKKTPAKKAAKKTAAKKATKKTAAKKATKKTAAKKTSS